MGIIRGLTPDTKVFVVADHGFGAIGRERIQVDLPWLNEPNDCFYLNAWLRQTLGTVGAPRKVRDNVLEFSVSDLRMPIRGGVDRATNKVGKRSLNRSFFPNRLCLGSAGQIQS